MIETKIIRTVISQFPAIVPHLKGRARWIAFTYCSYDSFLDLYLKCGIEIPEELFDAKSYDYFLSTLENLVKSVYDGNLGGGFVDVLANLISGQLRQATEQAWSDRDGEGEIPDYLTAAYETAVLCQYDHVDQFYRDIIDARIDETPIDPLLSRAAMWASQWDTMYRNALLLIDTNNGGNLIWRKGETEHGCATCAALDGIVMWASEWDALGVHPRGYPNNKLECQGGGPANNCDCVLEPTDQRRTAGAYGRVEEIIL